MLHLSTWEVSEGGKVLKMGKQMMPQGDQINTETELRDQLIDLVSVGNLRHKPTVSAIHDEDLPPKISAFL